MDFECELMLCIAVAIVFIVSSLSDMIALSRGKTGDRSVMMRQGGMQMGASIFCNIYKITILRLRVWIAMYAIAAEARVSEFLTPGHRPELNVGLLERATSVL